MERHVYNEQRRRYHRTLLSDLENLRTIEGTERALVESSYRDISEGMSIDKIRERLLRGLSRRTIDISDIQREMYGFITISPNRNGLTRLFLPYSYSFSLDLTEALESVHPSIDYVSIDHFYNIGAGNKKEEIKLSSGKQIYLQHKGYLNFRPKIRSLEDFVAESRRFLKVFTQFANRYNEECKGNGTFAMKVPAFLCELASRFDNVVFYGSSKEEVERMRQVAQTTFNESEVRVVDNNQILPNRGQDYYNENRNPIDSFNKIVAQVVAKSIIEDVIKNPDRLKPQLEGCLDEEGNLSVQYVLDKVRRFSSLDPEKLYYEYLNTLNLWTIPV